jgi:signal transduction histidine kinase
VSHVGRTLLGIRLQANALRVERVALHGIAVVILTVVLWLNVLLWPTPHLGFDADPQTGVIAVVTPGSAAARAGLRVHDRILRLYNYPWHVLMMHPYTLPLINSSDPNVPVTVERQTHAQSVILHATLVKLAPSLGLQTTKAAMLVLAFLCWITGYLLGIVRRQDATSSPLVAFFWLLLAGTIGTYIVILNISRPLYLFLQWLLLAILAPLGVYIHCWFPVRTVTVTQLRMIRRVLVASSGAVTLCIATIVLSWPAALVELTQFLRIYAVPLAVLFACVTSGILLLHTYHQQTVAHVRRQIRLIALACIVSGAGWLFMVLLPIWLAIPAVVADQRTNLIVSLIPLAYLIGGVTPDLYRLDRVMARLAAHATASVLLAGIFALVTSRLPINGTDRVLWSVLGMVACYRPLQWLLLRTLPLQRLEERYGALHRAAVQLTTTLDDTLLVQYLLTGVRQSFQAPALAFYRASIDASGQLTLTVHERFESLPNTLATGTLTRCLCQYRSVILSRQLMQDLADQPLDFAEEQALRHPGIVIWGGIHAAEGTLLGILLLGMRGDLDSYRTRDLHELDRLLGAAALAFANSTAYTAQREAEMIIRTLYQQLNEAQQATSAAIARELHDEIINVSVRLNIEALQRLRIQVQDPKMQAELSLVLETEQSLVQALRMVCERLHPVGIDDPLALAAVLRMQVDRVRATWDGACHLVVTNPARPVLAQVQYEAMQITREALTNAVKHARSATEIVVELQYPLETDGMIELCIRDNGQATNPITVKPGHWGLRGMMERARLAGGKLAIERITGGGTAVRFVFAPAPDDTEGGEF